MMMKFAKSFSFILLTAVVLTTTGLGCKGLSKTEQQSIAPVSLEWWTVFDDVDAINSQVAKYRQLRPYLTVNVRQLSQNEFYPRLVEALARDQQPDIISVSNRDISFYQTFLTALPPTVRDTTVLVTKSTLGTNTTVATPTRGTLTLTDLDNDYVQTVAKDVVRGGQIYGLPLSIDTLAIYYNKDLLDRAGIPEPPKTWEEFQADVKKISKYDKTGGKIIQSGTSLGSGDNIPGSDDILATLLKQSQIDIIGRNGRAAFNFSSNQYGGVQTPSMTVMNFYTDFANPDRDTYSWNELQPNAVDAFANGQVGFLFGYSYTNAILKARAPQLNYRIMPLLQLNPERPADVANYWVQSVLAKSKHQNEAWALITYLTHSSATKDYLDATGRPTAMRAFIADQKKKLELDPFVSQILIADNWYRGRDYVGASRAIKDMMKEWLVPSPEPEKINQWRQEILNRAAAKINQTL